ncbi:MAG: hypothetical protein K8I82_21770 [Anaerolineae bacterium]|nr:hypothetical protein [Anaerolineae bacterium]
MNRKTPPPLITASEIARHVYCARALFYDRSNPDVQNPNGQLWRWLKNPWRAGVLLLSLSVLFAATLRIDLTLIAATVSIFLFFLVRYIYHRMRQPDKDILFHGIKAHHNRKTLIAKEFGLVGKPDYLLEIEGYKIPVLAKDMPGPETPYEAHIMELVAFGMIVAENEPRHPLYGVIRYTDGRTFEVDFDEDAIEVLSGIMDEIETNRAKTDVSRSHEERRRCYACRYRNKCDQNLFV